MAKVTIVIEDTEDGEIRVEADFTPVITRPDEATPAHIAAVSLLDSAAKLLGAEEMCVYD